MLSSLVFLLVLVRLYYANAQQVVCVESSNFNSTSQIAALCIPFLQGPVFVNVTQPTVDVIIASTLRTLQLAPQKCAEKAIELTCQTYYPTCINSTLVPSLQLPSPACKYKCYASLMACASFIQENMEVFEGQPSVIPTDCDIKDNGMERWPVENVTYNILGYDEVVDCNAYSTGEFVSTKPDSCPFVMHPIAHPAPDEDPCIMQCPLPVFPAKAWEHDMAFAYTLAWISIFCLLFLIFSFLLNANKRKFPQNLFINLFCTCLCVVIFIIIGTLGGRYEILCHNGKPSVQSFIPCGMQGSVIMYAALAAVCWWFSIVVNLYLMVSGKIKANNFVIIKYYYWFSYGFPAFLVIVALSLKSFGFYAPNIICFLPIEGSKEWVQYVLYYVPVGVMMIIGAVLNVMIIYQLVMAYYNVASQVDKRSLTPYYRVSFFLVGFLFIWIAIFTRMGVAKNTTVHDSFVEFTLCHITYYSLSVPSVEFCGNVPKIQPAIGILRVQYVAMTVHGILSYLLFCHDIELYTGWAKVFNLALEKIYPPLKRKRREVKVNPRPVSMQKMNVQVSTTNSNDANTNTNGDENENEVNSAEVNTTTPVAVMGRDIRSSAAL